MLNIHKGYGIRAAEGHLSHLDYLTSKTSYLRRYPLFCLDEKTCHAAYGTRRCELIRVSLVLSAVENPIADDAAASWVVRPTKKGLMVLVRVQDDDLSFRPLFEKNILIGNALYWSELSDDDKFLIQGPGILPNLAVRPMRPRLYVDTGKILHLYRSRFPPWV